jgi:hypothetical protein
MYETQGELPIARPSHGRKDIIKINLKEVGCEVPDHLNNYQLLTENPVPWNLTFTVSLSTEMKCKSGQFCSRSARGNTRNTSGKGITYIRF